MIPPDFPFFDYGVVYRDTNQEAYKPLLWQPKMVQLHKFAMLVEVDEATSARLCNCKYPYNYLTLCFFVQSNKKLKNKNVDEPDFTRPAVSSVMLYGCDDFCYGAPLPAAHYTEFYPTWEKLLTFVREMDFKQQKFNGELLMDFCTHQLGATELFYN